VFLGAVLSYWWYATCLRRPRWRCTWGWSAVSTRWVCCRELSFAWTGCTGERRWTAVLCTSCSTWLRCAGSFNWPAAVTNVNWRPGDCLGCGCALPTWPNYFFFFLRCRVVVDNVGDHVMPEQSVFCRPDELGWAYVILQTCTQTVQILLSLSSSCSSPFYFSSYH